MTVHLTNPHPAQTWVPVLARNVVPGEVIEVDASTAEALVAEGWTPTKPARPAKNEEN